MSDLSDIIRILPPMKSGNELLSALEVLPEYNSFICDADASVRLMALSDLYRIYVPNQMSLEIYSKLYLALMRSLQKKGTKLSYSRRTRTSRPSCSRSTAASWAAPTASQLLGLLALENPLLSVGQSHWLLRIISLK